LDVGGSARKRKRLNFNRMSTEAIITLLGSEEKKGRYRVLGSKDARKRTRDYYRNLLTLPVKPTEETALYIAGELLATTYTRIVIGDHGAYVEISPEAIRMDALRLKLGQECRVQNPLCKYVWYESKEGDKVYYQKGTVKYADYKIGQYYVDPTLVKNR